MPTGYSVHVGVSSTSGYAAKAQGCVEAAQELATRMANLGFTVEPVLDDANATLSNVQASLRRVFAKLVADDILVFTLAGHGEQFPDGGDPTEKANQYFALYDGWWMDNKIYQLLGEITVKARVFIVAEACRSGSLHFVPPALLDAWNTINPLRVYGRWLLKRAGRSPTLTDAALRATLTANVLLLAAASEQEKALPAQGRDTFPPFSEALFDVMDVASDYQNLCDRMEPLAVAKGNPEPVLNTRLVSDMTFVSETPFSI